MKILYHHRTRLEDAQGIHIYEMVKAFRDAGHDVDFVGLVKMDEADGEKLRKRRWKWLNWRPPNWLYEVMSLAYNLYGYWHLCQSVRSNKPSLIYERYALNTFCGVWVGKRFGIPVILEVNAPLYYEQSRLGKLSFKRLARFSERWICSHSTWTVVVSQVIKDFLVRQGVPEEKIIVMPNGIDPQKFHPGISGKAVRSKYRLEGKRVIGFVGWLRPWHRLESLLDVLRDKRFESARLHLLLVGDGPAYSNLYDYAERYDLLSAVTFTGAVKRGDIPEYIAAMDIAVQPSAPEYACPMKIIEYMGMGKCIVAPDQPNIREIINANVNGYLFETEIKDSFQQILLRLISNPQLRNATAQNAFKTIFDRGLLWHSNANKILSLLGDKATCISSTFPGSSGSSALAQPADQDLPINT
jgi:glycosyltransferase involved in cell wall biosynthesis